MCMRYCVSAVVAASVLLMAGCEPGAASGGGTGTVKISITDAPFPVDFIEEAIVTLVRIEIRRADDDAGEPAPTETPSGEEGDGVDDDGEGADDADDDDAGSPFVTVFEGPADINLLDLRCGVTAAIGSVEAPAGTYNLIRLIVEQGTIKLTDGRSFDLRVPSGEQTGIKLFTTFTVEDGEVTDLLLDFDLSRAFVPIPGGQVNEASDIDRFQFKPSHGIRAVDLGEAGAIAGSVTDGDEAPLAGATVSALQDDTVIATTTTCADGAYALLGLPPGDYVVRAEREEYLAGEGGPVTVTAGEETAADIALAAASP